MTINWLGHACFVLESGGYRVLVDPFRDVRGYHDIAALVDEVCCSHGHYDHSYTDRVTLLGDGKKSPFKVKEIPSYHDGEKGALRGENTIRRFKAEGLTVVHLGDLGHQLSDKQVEAIGPCDVLLVPVGGTYTLDPMEAKAVVYALQPRVVIPMHYRHAPHGLSAVAGVEPFLQLWAGEEIHRLSTNTVELTAEMGGVWLPAYVKP